jgi:hypothetical protein
MAMAMTEIKQAAAKNHVTPQDLAGSRPLFHRLRSHNANVVTQKNAHRTPGQKDSPNDE